MAVPSTVTEKEALAVDILRSHIERIASTGQRHRITTSSISAVDTTLNTVTITTVYTLAKDDGKDVPNVEGLHNPLPGIGGNPSVVTP